MPDTDWRKVRDSVAIEDVSNPVNAAIEPDLDSFELATGIRLPKSFRGYTTAFGPGTLAGEFSIRAPGYHVDGTSVAIRGFNEEADLLDFNQAIRRTGLLQERRSSRYSDWDRLSRMLFFADNSANDLVGWDPQEMTDATKPEYAIYLLRPEDVKATRLAVDFSDFVIHSCFEPIGDFVPPKTFRPASRLYLSI